MPIKNLEKIVHKSKPNITGVLVTDKHFIATDSYKLVEIEHKGEPLPAKCIAADPKAYPEVSQLWPTAKAARTIRFTAGYLKQVAEFFEKNGSTYIDMELQDDNLSPVVFKSAGIRALLMQALAN